VLAILNFLVDLFSSGCFFFSFLFSHSFFLPLAIIECADAAHGLGAHIIGDGGCTVPGGIAIFQFVFVHSFGSLLICFPYSDLAKAFGGGADVRPLIFVFCIWLSNNLPSACRRSL
jgi:hypothetical protein